MHKGQTMNMKTNITMNCRLYALKAIAALAVTASFWLGQVAGAQSPVARPNIILIMADDMGYSDLGCYGGEIETPHLDRLADHGLRFTQFYNCARCWPSRASLLTGLYNDQTGIHDLSHQLNRRCVTIAEVLRSAGYGTYMVGKWHLMENSLKYWKDPTTDRWPIRRGFDHFYGTPVSGSLFNPFNPVRDQTSIKIEDKDYYVTDALTGNAIEYIRDHNSRRKDDPFFLYVAHFAPHYPLQARPEDIELQRGRYDKGWQAVREARYKRMIELGILDPRWKLSRSEVQSPTWKDAKHKEWEARRMEVHAAMVYRMDHSIGRIVDTLKKTGQLDNTLIFFLSDNGASSEGSGGLPFFEYKKTLDGKPMRSGNNPKIMPGPADTYQSFGRRWANVSDTPFRKYKAYTHEGGIATPLIAHWPKGILARGELRHQPGHVIDIMATCVELSGASYPDEHLGKRIHPMAGISLVPALANKTLDRDAIYFQHLGNRAVRAGKWKLVALRGKPWELYDLDADRSETTKLAGRYPQQVEKLRAQWHAWANGVDVNGKKKAQQKK
jgi:arylsulfatase A-like enzyme